MDIIVAADPQAKPENSNTVNENPTEEKPDNDDGNETEKSSKNIHYENDVAIYTDPESGTQYQWSAEQNQWLLKTLQPTEYGFEDNTHTYVDSDGIKFFWDVEKRAWFPKIDDDFMAIYQMNYGVNKTDRQEVVENRKEDADVEVKSSPEDLKKVDDDKASVENKRKIPNEPNWFEIDETQNTKVYVSNLPNDITEQEFVDHMQKCGLVMRDPSTGDFKVKLYKEPGTDYLKGDALCTFIRIESVELALNLLDGSDLKGQKISVERAKFQMKGKYDPTLKPKSKKRKDKVKLKRLQEKLFDWRPEKVQSERAKHERVVIVTNLFEPALFDSEVSLILEFQEDLREECSKLGQVRKVMIYDRHPDGVAQINMGSPEEADEVVKLLNGRWFMKRQLGAAIWDGRTKYKIAETDSQISQRLDTWDKFLDDNKETNDDETTASSNSKVPL